MGEQDELIDSPFPSPRGTYRSLHSSKIMGHTPPGETFVQSTSLMIITSHFRCHSLLLKHQDSSVPPSHTNSQDSPLARCTTLLGTCQAFSPLFHGTSHFGQTLVLAPQGFACRLRCSVLAVLPQGCKHSLRPSVQQRTQVSLTFTYELKLNLESVLQCP